MSGTKTKKTTITKVKLQRKQRVLYDKVTYVLGLGPSVVMKEDINVEAGKIIN